MYDLDRRVSFRLCDLDEVTPTAQIMAKHPNQTKAPIDNLKCHRLHSDYSH